MRDLTFKNRIEDLPQIEHWNRPTAEKVKYESGSLMVSLSPSMGIVSELLDKFKIEGNNIAYNYGF